MSIGNKIKTLREQKGLSQKELASLLNISQAAVSQFENGSSPPKITTLEKIALVLNASIQELLGWNETQSIQENSSNLADKIYKLRTDHHLSQKEFAIKINTSQSAVNYWENGKRQPRIEHLQKISTAFNVPIGEFIEEIPFTKDDFDNAVIQNSKLLLASLGYQLRQISGEDFIIDIPFDNSSVPIKIYELDDITNAVTGYLYRLIADTKKRKKTGSVHAEAPAD